MYKRDLKNRMVVKLMNGDIGIIVDDFIMFPKTYMQLSQYNEDLTVIDSCCKSFDIIKIFNCTCTLDYLYYVNNDLELIWERK